MAEPFLDDLRVDPGAEGQRRPCVAKVVEPDPGDRSGRYRLGEELADAVGVPGGAVFAREDMVQFE